VRILTKSKYLFGLECPHYLWVVFNNPDERREPTLAQQFRFDEGNKVGELAKKLFPKGIDLPTEYLENMKTSKAALKKKKPLFEAGFEVKLKSGKCYSRADVLVPVGKEWDIVEVKSGTKVKDINVHDVAFQKYVYELNGIKIRKCYLMHLNIEYERKGKLNLKKLFVKEDITSKVNEATEGIEQRITEMFRIISFNKPPKPLILMDLQIKNGNHSCLSDGCIELPDNNVFCLYRGGKRSSNLFESGIDLIKDIPPDFKLTDKQQIQRMAEIKGKSHVDKKKLREFLKTLKYPIYYLDFEAFSTSIPMFDGLHPYSQVPFQFSVYVVKKANSKPVHSEYLYEGKEDPRKEFVSKLKKLLGSKGSIVVYGSVFEKGRLKELANYFPKYSKWVDKVLPRIVDLLIPFREFAFYNSKQQGSASLKRVLPVMTNKSYQGMGISGGMDASIEFFNMTYGNYTDEQKKEARQNLLKYCGLDTFAEVLIVKKMRKLAK